MSDGPQLILKQKKSGDDDDCVGSAKMNMMDEWNLIAEELDDAKFITAINLPETRMSLS